LPAGVKIVPFLDRSDLVQFTTHTVFHNLSEGILLVVIVLFLMLGNVRCALIVALTIPFSLLFAATCLKLKAIPANLLSLGGFRLRHGNVYTQSSVDIRQAAVNQLEKSLQVM
jgi:cobalt-zinc-cadmium resistance protein CzcA